MIAKYRTVFHDRDRSYTQNGDKSHPDHDRTG